MKKIIQLLIVISLSQVVLFGQNSQITAIEAIEEFPAYLSNGNLGFNEVKDQMREVLENYGTTDYRVKQFLRFEAFWDNRAGSDLLSPGSFADYHQTLDDWINSNSICTGPNNLNWLNIGADVVKKNSGPIITMGNGRSNAISVNATNPDILLCGTNASGIWRTSDGGQNWGCVTDNLRYPGLGINGITPHPNNSNILIAATGKTTDVSGDTYGMGILESSDAGVTWSRVSSFPFSNNGIAIKAVIDPNIGRPSDYYVMTRTKVFHSSNAEYGPWNVIFDINDNTYPIQANTKQSIEDLIVHEDGTLFLSTLNNCYPSGTNPCTATSQIWKKELNQNWVDIRSTLPNITNSELRGAFFTDIHPANSDIFFIGTLLKTPSSEFTIFKTTDGGATFSFFSSQTNYYPSFGEDKLGFVSSIDGSKVYNGSCGIGFTTPTGFTELCFINNCGLIAQNYHTDVRDAVVYSDGTFEYLLLATDGGISRFKDISNPSAFCASLESLNGVGLTTNQSYSVSVSQFGNKKLITGNQDNSTLQYNFTNQEWRQVPHGGDGHETWLSSDGNNMTYLSNSIIRNFFTNGNSTIVTSIDDWGLNMPVEIDEKNHSIYYTIKGSLVGNGTPTRIRKKVGNTLTTLEIPVSTSTAYMTEIEYDESNPDIVYFSGSAGGATVDNKLFKSVDGLASFINLSNATVFNSSSGNPKSLNEVLAYHNISSLKLNSANSNELWLGISSVVLSSTTQEHRKYRCLHSTDGGNTWTDYSEGLPPFPLNDIEHIKGTEVLLAATDVGMYKRGPGDTEWICYQGDMPVALIMDIAVDYCDKKIYLATFGRGVFETDLTFAPNIEKPDMVIKSGVIQKIEETHNCVSSIVINNGGRLEVTGKLYMNEGTKIIVKPGGRLVVDGGIITNGCGELWQGIEIWGNSHLSQLNANQGKVILEDALIEHAEIALRVWKPWDWNSTGGVVKVKNSTLLNNRKSVEFINYQHMSSNGQNIYSNYSYFRNVEFVWDDDFRAQAPLNHVTMYKVHGVNFLGCDFKDDRSNPTSEWITQQNAVHCGILSIDANYKVQALNTDKSKFENLDFGVYAMNGSTDKSIRVDGSELTNNLYGVELVSINNPEINRNTFNFTNVDNNFETLPLVQYGIHATSSVGIQIEENVIKNISTGNSTVGVISSNLGENPEEIRNNEFESLTISNFAQGLNRNIDPMGITSGIDGLQFLCNENASNRYDHIVKGTLWNNSTSSNYSSSDYGIANSIGNLNSPSKNTLTQLSQPEEDFNNESVNNIDYYWTTSQNSEEPLQIQGMFSAYNINLANECPTSFTAPNGEVPGPYFPSGMVVNLTTDFNVAAEQLQTKSSIYESLINGGNTQSLLQTVSTMTANNSSQIRQDLANLSPFLTEAVIKAVLDYSSTIYPYTWQYDLVIDNIDVVKQYGFINYLSTKSDPLPNWMIQNIENYAVSGVVTQKQLKESELSTLGSKKAKAANQIMQYYKQDTILILDSIRNWIINKNEPLSKARLIDTYLEENNFSVALQEINSLNTNLNSYPTYLQAELTDIIAFKTFLANTLDIKGAIANLEPTDLTFLRNMADNGIGLSSYQARSILCFFYDECIQRDIEIPMQTKSKKVDQLTAKVKSKGMEIKVYPNPAHQYVAVELPLVKENSTIQVYAITGELVFKSTINKPIFIWDTRDFDNGTYVVNISNVNYETVSKKVVVQH